MSVGGCISLYGPVEAGVRYRIGLENGETRVLGIVWRDDALELTITNPAVPHEATTLRVSLVCDCEGRAHAVGLFASCLPGTNDRVELERFASRLIAGAFARHLSPTRLTA